MLRDGEIFSQLQEAKIPIECWRQQYNPLRPRSALGYWPPTPEAIEISPPKMNLLRPVAAQGLTQGADYHWGQVSDAG
jgi:hypothetical protein